MEMEKIAGDKVGKKATEVNREEAVVQEDKKLSQIIFLGACPLRIK